MAVSWTAPAFTTDPPSRDPDHKSVSPKADLFDRGREGPHCFYWIAGLDTLNSLFAVIGNPIHRSTGFGSWR